MPWRKIKWQVKTGERSRTTTYDENNVRSVRHRVSFSSLVKRITYVHVCLHSAYTQHVLHLALTNAQYIFCSISNDPFYAENVHKFKESIEITSKATAGSGYIAVKPTALCAPNLWVKLL